jgi:hypothetical protein
VNGQQGRQIYIAITINVSRAIADVADPVAVRPAVDDDVEAISAQGGPWFLPSMPICAAAPSAEGQLDSTNSHPIRAYCDPAAHAPRGGCVRRAIRYPHAQARAVRLTLSRPQQ